MESVVVVASNTFSRDWLEEIIPRLRLWEGAKLLMVGMSEFRSVPGNRFEPEAVLRRLSHRHPDLLINRWRVLSAENREGPDCETFLVLSIPETLVRLLRQRNF
ncbi:hypothetical protein TSAR_004033 [Trichomalopsis sarcophagae]|uniref:DUF4780 domain-containing protein n=1 Tax=Trichomalopsis sarcophagae TaxID=543379 RepID=A0A232EI61_9HYME|nr:hypothetical protein TSAR_004033 [Trichomalopsis sarcophagae]